MKKIARIMLVEDNVEYKEVIRIALEHEPDVELLSHFGTAEIALCTLQDSAACDQPDLIILDLRLPGMDGLTAIPAIRKIAPDTKIIVLSQSDRAKDVLRSISLGASGYLLKSATLNEITESIQTVMSGGASLDKGVAKFIVENLQTRNQQTDEPPLLSERELEIITLLAQGLVKKEIASQLNIGYSTVDTHVAHIYEKLKVNNAPSAINQAHRLGLLML
ncbi:response regulator [Aporhodopirellula aestuarii]|uniref:Response regulator transcription factor n=1 Tax=Aporhodopirellula aestuarii TaxID=2950107 RepID=A0ABT0UBE7_9BACT|nr:response regulator transcription factor [Aporhodopirellula aestuarii]MCM2374238.1 response regulator transcription factor [Aporhodopirellula aestuarii]